MTDRKVERTGFSGYRHSEPFESFGIKQKDFIKTEILYTTAEGKN